QHWLLDGGKLNGRAIVYPGQKFPRVSFTLAGSNVYTGSITTSNLDAQGELNWPVLDIQRANVLMADTSHLDLSGKYDFAQKTVQDGRLNSSGPFGGQFLPAGYSFDTASLSGTFAGPLASITNSVTAQIRGISVPHVNRLDR